MATWQQNVVVVAMLATVGVVAGIVVHLTQRLAPGMWTHLFFDVVAVLFALSQLD